MTRFRLRFPAPALCLVLAGLQAQVPAKPEEGRASDLLDLLNTPIVSASKR